MFDTEPRAVYSLKYGNQKGPILDFISCLLSAIFIYLNAAVYMPYTSLFSLLSTSVLLIPFFLSLSPWNGHLRLFALSGMSGTRQSSHGKEEEEGEQRRRMREEAYSKSLAPEKVREKENVAEKGGLCGRL